MSPHIITFLTWLSVTTMVYGQNSVTDINQYSASNSFSDIHLVSLTPAQMLASPQKMLDTWLDKPLSLAYYSAHEKEIQTLINESSSEQIITSSNVDNKNEWTEIDVEPITPYTWKWIDVDLVNTDGSHSSAQLRRPNWWIKKLQADKVGNRIYLNLPEMGMQGMATVVSIRVNQLDSRLLNDKRNGNSINRPVTGKYIHQSKNVYHIYFDSVEKHMGVTGNHPVWSSDRNGWVEAQDLKVGEQVKTYWGKSKINSIQKHDGEETVYNLEVYRDHNYYASSNSVLAHNECWNGHWDELLEKWNNVAQNVGGAPGFPVAATRNSTRRVLLDYEHAPRTGMVPWRRNTNDFLGSLDLEEELAIAEGAENLVVKIMMPAEGYSFDNMITTDVLRTAGYETRIYTENGMNWVEGTKSILRTPSITPTSNRPAPSTIPAPRQPKSNSPGSSTIPIRR